MTKAENEKETRDWPWEGMGGESRVEARQRRPKPQPGLEFDVQPPVTPSSILLYSSTSLTPSIASVPLLQLHDLLSR